MDLDGIDGFDRTRNEARMLCQLETTTMCPKMLGTRLSDRAFYLIEEYIEGTFVSEMISRRRFAQTRGKRDHIVRLICRGLERIHRLGVVWGDLKPQNILFDGRRVVFIDFESATRVLKESRKQSWGTAEFAPPEWKKPFSGSVSLAHDIYSLGVTIALLSGVRLASMRHSNTAGARCADRRYNAIIQTMMARNSRKRPSAMEICRSVFVIQKARPRLFKAAFLKREGSPELILSGDSFGAIQGRAEVVSASSCSQIIYPSTASS
jgi:serine/threonine protein kinase